MNGIQLSPTSPDKMSLSIKIFLKKIGLNGIPRFLKHTKISDEYKAFYCLDNCETELKEKGYKTVFGWIIWQDKKAKFLETEFHAVILKNNELVDITPRVDGEEKILFVPDKTRKAIRFNENTWDTWKSFKSMNGVITEVARPILLTVDPTVKTPYSKFVIENNT